MERVTGIVSGDNLIDCLRGRDNTTPRAHAVGAVIEDIWDSSTWNDSVDAFLEEHNQDGTHSKPSVSVTTKGDLQTFSTVPDRLGKGNDGQLLESRASEATGLKWVDPPSTDSVNLIAAPTNDHSSSGLKIALTATANMAFGDVGYIASTGKVTLIDADAIATMSGIVMCADATINADASGNFLLQGIARDDTWNWTVGGIIYGTVTGTSGNTLSQTAPSGTDDVVQIMGVATHADRMYFNPQLVQIERV